ncbi:hypothetical protein ABZ915_17660 [Streptomyces sp. NPDC046915]|uniref:hypothetical protein n=1 Tax=Streptomyces sp. NPDC046915 TaxID=3155257 RepID=UPI0033CC3790
MTISFRQIAASGGAAVALLGGAAAITAAAPVPASAATQTVAHRAVTAPVNLPDGRTIRVTGMGGYGHQATVDHVATVASYKTSDTTTGVTPDNGGVGTQLQNPLNTPQSPAGYSQITTQSASGGVIGVSVVAILILAIIVFYKVKHGGLKVSDAIIGGLFGLALSGTVIGSMGAQMTNSLVGSLGSMLGGLG